MKKLLNKVNFDTTAFLVFMMVSVLTFSFSIGSFRSGNKPIKFFSKIEGEVVSVTDNGHYSSTFRSGSISYNITTIQVKGFRNNFCNKNPEYARLFHKGQKVKFLINNYKGYYFFVEATEGDKVLVKYHERKGNIVFATMIISGILTLFCAYIRLFYKKEKSKN